MRLLPSRLCWDIDRMMCSWRFGIPRRALLDKSNESCMIDRLAASTQSHVSVARPLTWNGFIQARAENWRLVLVGAHVGSRHFENRVQKHFKNRAAPPGKAFYSATESLIDPQRFALKHKVDLVRRQSQIAEVGWTTVKETPVGRQLHPAKEALTNITDQKFQQRT
uniref:Uncharacterized protein n=1 Tax=Rhodosorus marinus TaxID=101924 RepID=A0A7S3A467_9RHOD|mmetsp:Transcript_44217/g.172226  ORF Transcript_44217/g.172226 Transcript_44217/m.172226 type:complete len:166 (+) Transcript_44217:361-858(+)